MSETLLTTGGEQTTAPTEGSTAAPSADQGQAASPAPTEASTDQPAVAATTYQPAAKPADVAPESYEFNIPEGVNFSDGVKGALSDFGKERNLTQEGMQGLIDKVAPVMAAEQVEQVKKVHAEWAESTRADPEIGGDKLNENLALAKKAMDATASQGFKDLLNATGLGNHPEVVRHFVNLGKQVSTDTFVGGRSAQANDGARRLYSQSNMNP